MCPLSSCTKGIQRFSSTILHRSSSRDTEGGVLGPGLSGVGGCSDASAKLSLGTSIFLTGELLAALSSLDSSFTLRMKSDTC